MQRMPAMSRALRVVGRDNGVIGVQHIISLAAVDCSAYLQACPCTCMAPGRTELPSQPEQSQRLHRCGPARHGIRVDLLKVLYRQRVPNPCTITHCAAKQRMIAMHRSNQHWRPGPDTVTIINESTLDGCADKHEIAP